jgi:molybdate transport system ATP-binding protein
MLLAEFEKRFAGGPAIRAALAIPTDRFSVTALFGPSGSGKTTILRCVAGLERPESGSIRFDGETWFCSQSRIHLPPQRRGIGLLFQDYALFPHLSVAKNIGYGIRRLPSAERCRRVATVLETLGLAGLENRSPAQLSGGQQQRVALARVLVCRPRLVLLDEPLSALDEPTREQLRLELRRWLAHSHAPAVMVTHDRTEAMALADDVVVLDEGRVCQRGPVHEVFSRPAGLSVARIVGIETIEPAKVLNVAEGLATVQVGGVRLIAVAQGPPGDAFICIRGEDVLLHPGIAEHTSARNQLRATIKSLVTEGPLVRIGLECGFSLTALITRPAAEELALSVGQTVTALIKAQAIHVLRR